MRVHKPLQISLQSRTFRWQSKDYLAVSYLLGFRFDDSQEILLEQDLWQFLPAQLGQDGILDVGMPKPRGEVLVYGDFYAPGGQKVTADRVEIVAGSLKKTLAVIGDRYWRPMIGPTPPESFTTMPIDYQHAFGGKGHEMNTLGKGMEEVDVFGEMRIPLPNIEYPDRLITDAGQRPKPAGFRPLDMMWQPRLSKMGTYDDNWKQNHFPGYPPDLDWTHFMCAPDDQWLDEFWIGNESFSILNMHPHKQELRGSLPAFRSRCFVDRQNQSSFSEIDMKAESLYLFPEAEIGVLLYRGSIEVEQDDATDIDNILVAYEDLSQPPRSNDYYAQTLKNRLDENLVFRYMMDTRDLIPDSQQCGFAIMLEQAGKAPESVLAQNMENRANSEMEKVTAELEQHQQQLKHQLETAGIDPGPYLEKFDVSKSVEIDDPRLQEIMQTIDKILPGATSGDREKIKITEVDFSQFDTLEKQVQEMVDSKKQEVKDQLLASLEQAKGSSIEEELREKIDTALQKMDAPPELPRPPGQETLDELNQQIQQLETVVEDLRSKGVAEEKIPTMDFDLSTVRQQLEESFLLAREGYRAGAHFVDGTPPHKVPLDIVKHRLTKALEKGESVAGMDLSGVDLSGMDLSNRDLSDCYLEYANLRDANLSGTNLDRAILTHANLSQANLTQASLQKTNLGGSQFPGADLSDAKTGETEFSKANLEQATLRNCDLRDMNFLETRFAGAEISACNLSEGNFLELDFKGAKFTGSNLSRCNFIKGQMQQVDFSEARIEESNFIECDCNGSSFQRASMNNVRFLATCNLSYSNFNQAILARANLRDAQAQHASFEETDIFMADFSGANLQDSKFYGAIGKRATFMKCDLKGADFSSVNLMEGSLMKARLTNADLRYSNLYAVEFMDATVGGTDFTGANLDRSKLQEWRPSA